MEEQMQAIADMLANQDGKATWEEVQNAVHPQYWSQLHRIITAMEDAGTARRVNRYHADTGVTEFYVTNAPKPSDGVEV